jgi:hypothetical protein
VSTILIAMAVLLVGPLPIIIAVTVGARVFDRSGV